MNDFTAELAIIEFLPENYLAISPDLKILAASNLFLNTTQKNAPRSSGNPCFLFSRNRRNGRRRKTAASANRWK
jgi:hypothetical protein